MKILIFLLLMALPLCAQFRPPTPDDILAQKQWALALAIKQEDAANGYAHSAGKILQVLPDGLIISGLMTRWGIYDVAFIKTDSSNAADGQAWTGILIPQPPYHCATALGTPATLPAFTTNLKGKASAPASSTYSPPRPPVSSLGSVGGGY